MFDNIVVNNKKIVKAKEKNLNVKKFNDNHAAMIRSCVSNGDDCKCFAKYSGQIILLLKDNATEHEVKIIENCLLNQISFLENALKHYRKGLEITQNILKK